MCGACLVLLLGGEEGEVRHEVVVEKGGKLVRVKVEGMVME